MSRKRETVVDDICKKIEIQMGVGGGKSKQREALPAIVLRGNGW